MNRTDPAFILRKLNGVRDKFALFAAALTTKEIAEPAEGTKP